MRLGTSILSTALVLATALPCVALTHSRRGPTSHKLFNKRAKTPAKTPSQHAIDDTRATQIQNSLIHSGYLSGEASGHWDAQTEAAMQKFQSDNGWQTKLIPDSRAIIKLGLGPNQPQETGSFSSDLTPTSSQPSFAADFVQK
jgi:peptidoglycan hydrolase-like protein with peptidoglycan-binding domain